MLARHAQSSPRALLWAARHARALAEGICYGRADVEVDMGSNDTARVLLESYPGPRPKTVWSSPSARCAGPAATLSRRLGAELAIDPRLSELSFGDWERRTWHDIETRDGEALSAWMGDWKRRAPTGGEALADLCARVESWTSALDRSAPHALVAHAGVVRVLRVFCQDKSWDESMREPVVHLAWTSFELPSDIEGSRP